jgi:peptidoglycan/LPS O-acetylase OafA/YrhL
MTKTRIQALDGFRAVAVLGVLWAHIWMFFGNPPLAIFHTDVAGIISFFGTGVDLFFVISGFCMYLMYLSKTNDFTWTYYLQYLKKRWLRIAPAFYVAILVYGILAVGFDITVFDWLYALKQALFIRNIFPEHTQYAPHFWSLCTEWHFYLVLPFIILGIKRFSFASCISMVVIVCLIFRLYCWSSPEDPFNVLNYSIPNRLIEFIMGVIAARVFVESRKEWIFKSFAGLAVGIFIALAGRVMMSAAFSGRADWVGLMSRVLDLPLLSMGFSIMIVNVLQHRTFFTSVLEHNILTKIGKYSYSMYLWHWLIAGAFSYQLKDLLQLDPFLEVNIAFVLSLLVLYPLSLISYRLFEAYYFKKSKKLDQKLTLS